MYLNVEGEGSHFTITEETAQGTSGEAYVSIRGGAWWIDYEIGHWKASRWLCTQQMHWVKALSKGLDKLHNELMCTEGAKCAE